VFQGESMLINMRLDDGVQVSVRMPTRLDDALDLPTPADPITVELHQRDSVLISGATTGSHGA
jgi:hypothetical protein